MSRNIVPRINKGADLGTSEKNWNRLYADAVILRGSDLKALLDGKVDLETLTAKGDLYVATDAGVITRLPAGASGYVLKSNPTAPEGLMWGPAGARQELLSNITVTVGSGGDFGTINAALNHLTSLYYPTYLSTGTVPRAEVYLLSGFEMREQVLVESLNLSWISITGYDPETIIVRSTLTREFWYHYPAFGVSNGGFLPIIRQLFNMDSSGDAARRHGVYAFSNARAIINNTKGVKNAGDTGVYADLSSIITANGVNVSGSGNYGIRAHGSQIAADSANASNVGNKAIFAWSGIIDAQNANAKNAGSYGISAEHGSIINANGADASGAVVYGINITAGSIVSAFGATGTLRTTKNLISDLGIIFQS